MFLSFRRPRQITISGFRHFVKGEPVGLFEPFCCISCFPKTPCAIVEKNHIGSEGKAGQNDQIHSRSGWPIALLFNCVMRCHVFRSAPGPAWQTGPGAGFVKEKKKRKVKNAGFVCFRFFAGIQSDAGYLYRVSLLHPYIGLSDFSLRGRIQHSINRRSCVKNVLRCVIFAWNAVTICGSAF